MSITDELREWAHGFNGPWKRNEEMLLAIADRIDAEHERDMAAAALIAGVPMTDENMAEHGWVCLPKDADGEYIHIGDEVTEHEDGYTFKVDGFMCWDGEWWVFQRDAIQAPARRCTHYHAPTVEDVLTEMVAKLVDRGELSNGAATTIAEYAAKLQLREVDE